MLPVFLLAAVVSANPAPVEWFAQRDLSKFHLNSLTQNNCFRGTYGALSLFTCPLTHVHLEPFATVSSRVKLCVVETSDHLNAAKFAEIDRESQTLFNDNEKYLVLASSDSYPSLCSRTAFQGYALNTMTVATTPVRPSAYNVLAGKEHLKSTVIENFINAVTVAELQDINTNLAFGGGTNINDPNANWTSRNSYGQGCVAAGSWVQNQFASSGPSRVYPSTFRADMAPNIIAEYNTQASSEIIVVGSHMDSRGVNNSSPTDPAPGADDNGSGTAINILFARLLQRQNIIPLLTKNLHLQAYTGEEQGLLGSRNLAAAAKNNNSPVTAMFNMDMVGYLPPNQTQGTVLTFMLGSVNADLTASCKAVVQNYLPTALIGDTTACCSDQQAWFENGFASLGMFETPTSSVVYPDYHRLTDTPDKVNFPQVALFAKAIYACILTAVLPQ